MEKISFISHLLFSFMLQVLLFAVFGSISERLASGHDLEHLSYLSS